MKLFTACFVLCLLGCGCAHIEKSTARSGPYPENYKEIIAAWLNTYLAFPQDVKDVRTTKPKFYEDEKAAGYYALVFFTPKTLDARNGREQIVNVFIRNGQVVSHTEPFVGVRVYNTTPPRIEVLRSQAE